MEWRQTARLYTGAALVGLPIFVVGHVFSGVDANLFEWVLAYEGNVENPLNDVYGAKWTIGELARGMAMVGFKFIIGSLVNPAGLGTVLSALIFGGQLEFRPSWLRIAVGVAAIPVAITVSLRAALRAVTGFKADPFIRFLSLWVGAYLCFNLLWNVGDEIFWFQILPITWILFLMSLQCRPGAVLGTVTASGVGRDQPWPITRLATAAALLIAVNTFNAVLPWADRHYLDNQRAHADLLREGDLEIVPGWETAARKIDIRGAMEEAIDLSHQQYLTLRNGGSTPPPDYEPRAEFIVERVGSLNEQEFQDIGIEYYRFVDHPRN